MYDLIIHAFPNLNVWICKTPFVIKISSVIWKIAFKQCHVVEAVKNFPYCEIVEKKQEASM